MMENLFGTLFIISLILIFLSIHIIISKSTKKFEQYYDIILVNLKFSYSFVILFGLIGTISSFFFYINVRIEYSIVFVVLVSLICSSYLFNNKKYIEFLKLDFNKYILIEKTIFLLIIYLCLTYFFRALAPWSDQDEITQYGYRTKLIGTGFVYSDNIVKGWPQFSESSLSYFYYFFQSTIYPKIVKVFGLISISVMMYEFLRLNELRRIWCLIGVLLFFITPEFSYMATSLKTDNTLMYFESTTIITMLIFIKYK